MIAFIVGVARVEAPSRSASGAEVDAAALMADHLLNYDAVKCFAAELPVRDRVDQAYAQTERAWRRFYGRRTVDGLIVASIFVVSFGAVMLLAASQVAAGRVTLGDFVLVNAYLLQLALPLETIGFAVRDMARGVVFLEKLIALLREAPEDQPVSDAELAIGGSGELIFDKVMFGYEPGRWILMGSDRAAVQAAARIAKIHDQVISWPRGYDTIVGEHGLKLSGGERQRVAIARVALRKPRVLVFDEATSALDSTTEGEILRNLIEISKGVTTVVVARRLSTVVPCRSDFRAGSWRNHRARYSRISSGSERSVRRHLAATAKWPCPE